MCRIAEIQIRFAIIHGEHSHKPVCVRKLYLATFTAWAWTMNDSMLLPFCCWPFTSLTLLTIFAAGIMAAMTCIVARLKRATKKISIVRHPTNHMHVVGHECSSKRFNESFPACYRQFQLYTSAHDFEWTIFNLISFQRLQITEGGTVNWLNVFNWLKSIHIERCHDDRLQCTCDAYGVHKPFEWLKKKN